MKFQKLFGLIIFIFFGLSISSQVIIPAGSQQIIRELNQLILTEKIEHIFESENHLYPINRIQGELFLSMYGKADENFKPENLPSSFLYGSRSGDVVTIKVPLKRLSDISNVEGITYLEVSPRVQNNLKKAILDTRVDSVHRGDNLSMPFTGKNVIVGVTDWGFDYTHPMFYDTALTNSRILGAWDQFRQEGSPPASFNYGTEIVGSSNLSSYQSDTACTYYSYATHGSHVAGIAGGGGAGLGNFGMAPDCEFLFSQFYLDAASNIDAVNWMKDFAQNEQKRLVVNMSWGLYHLGPLDGTSLLSSALNTFTEDGVVIVTSNGNNGNDEAHIYKDFNNDTVTSRINFYSYSFPNMWGQSITMWGEENKSFSSGIDVYNGNILVASTPFYTTKGISGYLDSILVTGSDTIFFNITRDSIHALNQRPYMRLRVKNKKGSLKVVLKSTSSDSYVHYWNITEITNGSGNWGMPFTPSGQNGVAGDGEYTVGEPACAEKVISVAAHASEVRLPNNTVLNGDLTSFSSRGPVIDGRVKPDISAPGASILSSISSFTDDSYTAIESTSFNGRTYDFARFSGTSMAGPMVTGIVALILEARPFATPEQIKSILKETARQDDKTGTIPSSGSSEWGWGKANAHLAIEKAIETIGIEQNQKVSSISVFPNPTNGILNIRTAIKEIVIEQISITNVNGQNILIENANNEIQLDVRNIPSGFYLISIQSNQGTFNSKFFKY